MYGVCVCINLFNSPNGKKQYILSLPSFYQVNVIRRNKITDIMNMSIQQ